VHPRLLALVAASAVLSCAASPASAATTSVDRSSLDRHGTIVVPGTGLMRVRASIESSRAVRLVHDGPLELTGSIDAPAITVDGATTRIEGALTAPRGRIVVLGGRVDLAGARVDANGGAVYLGDKTTTRYTTVDGDSTIDAGDGGHIELWSSDLTSMRGTAIARGGYIETSSRGVIDTGYAHYDASGGDLVFDPHNITVVSGAGQTGGTLTAGGNFTPTADGSTIGALDIKAALDANTSVTLDTGSGGAELGDIAVNADISTTSATAGLTLIAANKITLNNSIALGGGSLSMHTSGTIGNGGGISQPGGTITGAGTTTVQTTTTTDAKLTQANNDFGTVAVTGQVADLTFVDKNSIIFGAVAANGLVTVTAPSGITQSAAVSPGSIYILTADDTHDISLPNPGNDFIGLEIANARNVSVTDSSGISLDNFDAKGTADLTTHGAITQSGGDTMTVGGTLTLNSNSSTITLANPTNDFTTVAASNSGSLTVTDVDDVQFAATSLASLAVAAGGNVTQTGALQMPGALSVDAGSTHDVTLTNGSNGFGSVAFPHAHDAAVADNDGGGVAIGTSDITGNLTATANGANTQVSLATLAVDGTAAFTAAAGSNVTLTGSNDFATVQASGATATVNDINAVDLGASTLTAGLGVTAAGAVTQSGDLSVDGTAAIDSGTTHDVTLNRSGNHFGTFSISHTKNASVQDGDAGGLQIGGVLASDDLALTSAHGITQTGAISETGTLTATTPAASDAILSDGSNDLATVTLPHSHNVNVADSNGFVISGITAGGNLTVTTGGALTQSGSVSVTGTAAVAGQPLTLNSATNSFTGPVTVTAGGGSAATLRAAGDLTLATASAGDLTATTGDDLTVAAAGNIAATGALMLVADADNPSPAIGTGGITLAAGSALTSNGAARLYGARQGDNTIAANATINGATFTPGPHLVDSDRERYGAYAPGGTAAAPFTFFYKEADTDAAASVSVPADGATFERSQIVNAAYGCDSGGSGLASCAGPVASGSAIDTSTLGTHTFSVTATKNSGRNATTTVTYSVVDTTRPTVTLAGVAPRIQAGRNATVTYACADETQLVSCTGTLPSGSAVDTSTPGTKTFSVVAVDGSGNRATTTATYEVYDAGPCQVASRLTAAGGTLSGSAFGDHLVGLGADDTLIGLAGDDCIQGGDGNDKIAAGDGADRVRGNGGNDRIDGGAGSDHFLRGDAGNDVVKGGDGNDFLAGGDGNDSLSGGAGDDWLSGGAGNDRLTGGAGRNTYFGRAGKDAINSANGVPEAVNCGSGRDRVTADKNDKLVGCERVTRR
jgi:Ca2+-binding RTX toxin-like protein